jgi:adenosylmethionine-8-amino-7-oxononanoate aminotransferase
MSKLIERDKKFVWHPFTQHFTSANPIPIVEAKGVYLYDEDGNSYIDGNASWWVNTHGHGHPHILEALKTQFQEIDHIVFAGATHPKAVELAERICGHLPDSFEKVFFSDNGSTAVEVALKMALQYWHNKGEQKHRFLAIEGSYHGDTFGAMSVGQRGYFNAPFEPLFFDADYLDFPTVDNESIVLEKADKLMRSGAFAALIVEPLVQGAAGMRMYSADFLDQLTAIANKHDVLVIFDEVMTGFGRTGKLFALDHCKQTPDFVALSKGLTAGVMALGLTVTTKKIYDSFLGEEISKALLHGHSFTANPLACAVACANLDLFEEQVTWDSVANLQEWNRDFAEELERIDCVSNVRQQGTILAFEVTQEGEASYFSDLKTKAYEHFVQNGVLLRPLGNVVFINPPYCIDRREYTKMTDAIRSFLDTV